MPHGGGVYKVSRIIWMAPKMFTTVKYQVWGEFGYLINSNQNAFSYQKQIYC